MLFLIKVIINLPFSSIYYLHTLNLSFTLDLSTNLPLKIISFWFSRDRTTPNSIHHIFCICFLIFIALVCFSFLCSPPLLLLQVLRKPYVPGPQMHFVMGDAFRLLGVLHVTSFTCALALTVSFSLTHTLVSGSHGTHISCFGEHLPWIIPFNCGACIYLVVVVENYLSCKDHRQRSCQIRIHARNIITRNWICDLMFARLVLLSFFKEYS